MSHNLFRPDFLSRCFTPNKTEYTEKNEWIIQSKYDLMNLPSYITDNDCQKRINIEVLLDARRYLNILIVYES